MYYFIYNPASGNGRIKKQLPLLRETITKKFPNHYFATTVEPKDAASLAKQAQAQGYKTIIIIGGDGTVHETIQVLAHSDIALGIIPTGNHNTLAQKLGISTHFQQAITPLVIRKQQTFDLGQINHRIYFINSFSIGVTKKPEPQGALGLLGKLLLINSNLTLEPTSIHFQINSQYFSSTAAILCIVNTTWYLEQRFSDLIPDPFDGKVDLFLIDNLTDNKQIKQFKNTEKFPKTYQHLTYLANPDILIDKHPMTQVTIDGEEYKIAEPQLKVRCIPKAINIIIP